MTQYLREQEEKRKQMKFKKQEDMLFQQKEDAMMRSITQITCRMLRHCRNKEKRCAFCARNKYHSKRVSAQDYFEPIVPGLNILP